jgi:hypothetical protein
MSSETLTISNIRRAIEANDAPGGASPMGQGSGTPRRVRHGQMEHLSRSVSQP